MGTPPAWDETVHRTSGFPLEYSLFSFCWHVEHRTSRNVKGFPLQLKLRKLRKCATRYWCVQWF